MMSKGWYGRKDFDFSQPGCGPDPQITELLDYEISCTLQQPH